MRLCGQKISKLYSINDKQVWEFMANLSNDSIKRHIEISSLKREKEDTKQNFANFKNCWLPANTRKIIEAASTSLHVDAGLVLLAWLASVAGVDRGCHRIRHGETGYVNSLSLLILGGAESGSGKSSALEPFIKCISEIEAGCNSDHDSSNVDEEIYVKLKRRYNKLMEEWANTGDEAALADAKASKKRLNEIEKNRKKLQFLTSDITKAAYFNLMVDQGFVIRMESDGILLPRNAFNMVRKFWSGEAHSEGSISRGHATCLDPFIIDLVFTQIGQFTKFINDKNYIDTGLCARMLIYRAVPHDPRMYQTSRHELDKDIKMLIRKTLTRVNDCATSNVEHQTIQLCGAAEIAWSDFQKKCFQDASKRDDEINKWTNRKAQHALKIAGILHVAECSEPGNESVSAHVMNSAIEITEVLEDNLLECIAGNTNQQEKFCMCDIGLHILENNIQEFNATQIKQRFKDRFSAAEVDVALYKLVRRCIIRDITMPHPIRAGRPSGREYINRLYDIDL